LAKLNSSLIEAYIYRKSAREDFEYLILKRKDIGLFPSIWQMVSGTIEAGEKAYETAIREVKEETNLDVEKIFVVPAVSVFYYHERDTIENVPVFLCEVKNSAVKLSDEHDEYKWTDIIDAKVKLNWLNWKKNILLIDEILNDEKLFKTLREIKIKNHE
jgi:dihydroneopterin triphosphate diphosphatase